MFGVFKLIKKLILKRTNSKNEFKFLVSAFLPFTACNSVEEKTGLDYDGLIDTYVPPVFDFTQPSDPDPNFNILKSQYIAPYWVSALEMDNLQGHLNPILSENNSKIYFSMPTIKPEYLNNEMEGWTAATVEMQEASRQIFSKMNKILEVNFQEINTATSNNVVLIAQSIQVDTAGFSYFPNAYHEIGSDVFISTKFSNPNFINEQKTNFDYEVLIHEIGHAIGLKHPFEAHLTNEMVLTNAEDTTKFTAMSYTDIVDSFDGEFRPLDWLALTKYYGVNDNYNASDDVYSFSSESGVFVIDGSGIDTIDANGETKEVYIDLRQGAHSFVGVSNDLITAPNQMTISHDTILENVVASLHDDIIIGNDADNIIFANEGDDKIFLGGGEDSIYSGPGYDIVDFSEIAQSTDTLIFQRGDHSRGYDTVFGFAQGDQGDCINVSYFAQSGVTVLPVILSEAVPLGGISNHVLRIVSDKLNTESDVEKAFHSGGLLKNLHIFENTDSLMLTAASSDTGVDQKLFFLDNQSPNFEVYHLATFVGNYCDIDMWSSDNFSGTINEFIV